MKSRLSVHMAVLFFIAAGFAGVRGNAEDASSAGTTIPAEAVADPAKPFHQRLFSSSWSEGLAWRTVDDHLQLRVGLYFLLDGSNVSQDSSLDTISLPENGFHVRDSQIDIRGVLYRETHFRAQFNFSDGKAELQDNYFQRDGIPYVGSVRLGHFKEPFGLENSTSLRHVVFMERSLADTLTPSRGVGIAAGNTACGERFAWKFGVFWDTTSVEKLSESQSFSVMGRLTGLAIRNDENGELLHLGISLARRFMNEPLQYQARPEVNAAPRYLDTGDFSSDALTLVNLEAAYARGPLLMQGEYVWTCTSGAIREEQVTLNDIADEVASRYPNIVDWLQGRTGWERPSDSILWNIPFDLAARGEVSFFGVYGQASFVLTGEQRSYDVKTGVFGAPIPANPFSFRTFHGLGAWEVAARLSYLDLNDAYILGGRETNATLGVNWYVNENLRMALNYVHGEIERDTYDGSMDAAQMRIQIDLQPRRLDEYHPMRATGISTLDDENGK